ncbi:MAG: hypothetical protein ABH883_00490 [Candidatus Omnitrophota bacterium]
MNKDRLYPRINYIVDSRFQMKQIAYILGFLYIGAAIAGYTVYTTIWTMLGEKLAGIYPTGRLLHIFHTANFKLIMRLLFITPVFIVIGIFLSHRIAGPIYRMGKYIDTLVSGDYSHLLRLRKYEELQYLAHKLSVLCYSLKEHKERRDKEVDFLIESLKARNVSPDIVEEVLKRMKTP